MTGPEKKREQERDMKRWDGDMGEGGGGGGEHVGRRQLEVAAGWVEDLGTETARTDDILEGG